MYYFDHYDAVNFLFKISNFYLSNSQCFFVKFFELLSLTIEILNILQYSDLIFTLINSCLNNSWLDSLDNPTLNIIFRNLNAINLRNTLNSFDSSSYVNFPFKSDMEFSLLNLTAFNPNLVLSLSWTSRLLADTSI